MIARVVANGLSSSSTPEHGKHAEDTSGESFASSEINSTLQFLFLDSASDGISTKKRRVVAEADAVRLPLTKGWRRQTYVRSISSNCIRGDVIYYAPCGKRLGSYAEVVRVSIFILFKSVARSVNLFFSI